MIQNLLSVFGGSYPVDERRQSLRKPCRYAVYALDRKKIFELIVSDIGPRGLRVETVHKFRRGQTLQLIYRGVPGEKLTRLPLRTLEKAASKLPCKVLWCQKNTDAYQAGLQFEVGADELVQTWAKPVLDKMGLEKGAFTERRARTRARVCVNAGLKYEGETVAGLLTNLGIGGALFQSNKHLSVNHKVTLAVDGHPKLPRLRVNGEIVNYVFDVVSNSGSHSIEFKDVDQATLAILNKYVVHFLRTQGSG